uniref:Uncharacterized protein n=1 Tax=Oryza meridionalis TaxID=40149 RepID=A0A0E0F4H7_9ORYZ
MAQPWRRSVWPDRWRVGDGSAGAAGRGWAAALSAGGEATMGPGLGPGVTTATMASALAPFDALDEVTVHVQHDELRRLFSRFSKIKREKKIRAKLSFYIVYLSSIDQTLYFNVSSVLQQITIFLECPRANSHSENLLVGSQLLRIWRSWVFQLLGSNSQNLGSNLDYLGKLEILGEATAARSSPTKP